MSGIPFSVRERREGVIEIDFTFILALPKTNQKASRCKPCVPLAGRSLIFLNSSSLPPRQTDRKSTLIPAWNLAFFCKATGILLRLFQIQETCFRTVFPTALSNDR